MPVLEDFSPDGEGELMDGMIAMLRERRAQKGGPGSGFYDHEGRPGEVGGSKKRDGADEPTQSDAGIADVRRGIDEWKQTFGQEPRPPAAEPEDLFSEIMAQMMGQAAQPPAADDAQRREAVNVGLRDWTFQDLRELALHLVDNKIDPRDVADDVWAQVARDLMKPSAGWGVSSITSVLAGAGVFDLIPSGETWTAEVQDLIKRVSQAGQAAIDADDDLDVDLFPDDGSLLDQMAESEAPAAEEGADDAGPESAPEGWKPSMSADEARAYVAAKGSLFQNEVWHVTSFGSATKILEEGFSLGKRNFGRVWGDGAYFALDEATARIYEDIGGRAKLSAYLDLHKPLEVNLSEMTEGGGAFFDMSDWYSRVVTKALGHADTVNDYYVGEAKLVEKLRENTWSADYLAEKDAQMEQYAGGMSSITFQEIWGDNAMSDAFDDVLREMGYDALIIRLGPDFEGYESAPGGNQVVVFNPESIVVVNDPQQRKELAY